MAQERSRTRASSARRRRSSRVTEKYLTGQGVHEGGGGGTLGGFRCEIVRQGMLFALALGGSVPSSPLAL